VRRVGDQLRAPLLVGPVSIDPEYGQLVAAREAVLHDLAPADEREPGVGDEQRRGEDGQKDDPERGEQDDEHELLFREAPDPRRDAFPAGRETRAVARPVSSGVRHRRRGGEGGRLRTGHGVGVARPRSPRVRLGFSCGCLVAHSAQSGLDRKRCLTPFLSTEAAVSFRSSRLRRGAGPAAGSERAPTRPRRSGSLRGRAGTRGGSLPSGS
jgi:hypothetical protein